MYTCPVCGYLTFAEPPGSYDVCKVCGWEDDALQLEFPTTLDGGANTTTLFDAQAAYGKALTRLSRKHPGIQPPFERDPSWRPIDPQRDRFPEWDAQQSERAPHADDRLYYWRETFWYHDPAS